MKPQLPVAPERIDAECVCLGLQRAARVVARRYDDALRPIDLSSGQFAVLASIAGLQPVSVHALGAHLAMDRSTVTAALKPLVRRTLVAVETAQHDRRVRDIRLTAQGLDLLSRATVLWQHAQRDHTRRLGPQTAAPVLASLLRLG